MSTPVRVVWGGMDLSTPDTAVPRWTVDDIEGLLGDAPGVAATGQRVQADGQWATAAYRSGLGGAIGGRCITRTPHDSEDQYRALRLAASVNPTPLTVWEWSGPKTIMVRRDGDLKVSRLTPTDFEWSATVVADDPVWWWGGQTADGGLDDQFAWTVETGLPSRSGGLRFPLRFPLSFPSTGSTGDVTVTVETAARMEWRIEGPVTDPSVTVTNSDGSRVMAWTIELLTGEYLQVDPDGHASLLQGQAPRVPWQRQWPRLTPGENTISFRAGGGTDGRLAVTVWPLA